MDPRDPGISVRIHTRHCRPDVRAVLTRKRSRYGSVPHRKLRPDAAAREERSPSGCILPILPILPTRRGPGAACLPELFADLKDARGPALGRQGHGRQIVRQGVDVAHPEPFKVEIAQEVVGCRRWRTSGRPKETPQPRWSAMRLTSRLAKMSSYRPTWGERKNAGSTSRASIVFWELNGPQAPGARKKLWSSR